MVDIVIVTALWKRPNLTRLMLEHTRRVAQQTSLEVELVAVGSEGDQTRAMCDKASWKYVEHPNEALNHKWNQGVLKAQEFDPASVLILGSDDFIDQALLEDYNALIKNEGGNHGLNDNYALDLRRFMVGHWPGYRLNQYRIKDWLWAYKLMGRPCGPARIFDRPSLMKLGWKLWNDDPPIQRCLDGNNHRRLKAHGLTLKGHYQNEMRGSLIAVKNGQSIPQVGGLQRSWVNNPLVFLERHFSKRELNQLLTMHWGLAS